jgi:uncharacterized protein YndB with AHSA1/START domain
MAEQSETSAADREIVLTRRFDAPRELVWRAWTELEHVTRWWGPDGFTTTFAEFEVRQGGVWRFVMHGPDGTDYPNHMRFVEVAQPERLVYDTGTGPDDVMFRATVTFEAVGEATRVTMQSVFPTAALRDEVVEKYGAIEGGKEHLERLAAHLKGMQSL